MYADVITKSIKYAIEETNRRRTIQEKYNEDHHITPQTIKKKIEEDLIRGEVVETKDIDARKSLVELEEELKVAVERLDFEHAIVLRDRIKIVKRKK